jgi:hypothetical protein
MPSPSVNIASLASSAPVVHPLFVMLAGGVLPSVDTLCRDLDRFDEEALRKLIGRMVAHGLVPVHSLRRRQVVHLDTDTTVTPGLAPRCNERLRDPTHAIRFWRAPRRPTPGSMPRCGPGDTSFGNDDDSWSSLA